MRKRKELSAMEVRRLAAKAGMHAVGGVSGLYLWSANGSHASWKLRVLLGGRRSDIGLGGFPDVTLEQARAKARELRAKVEAGIDPLAEKAQAKAALRASRMTAITFAQAAKLCHAVKAAEFRNPKHAAQWIATLVTYAFPMFGKKPVSSVGLQDVLDALRPIWTTKPETAARVRGRLEQVLAWAKVSGYRSGDNPAAWRGNLDQLLPKSSRIKKVEHHRALDWSDMPAFMTKLRARRDTAAQALVFLILTAARSNEVRFMRWDEVDLTTRLWTIPAAKMKAKKDHRVPLSADAVSLLKALPKHEGAEELVFPSQQGKVMHDMSLTEVCRQLKADAVPHGFRSSFKDWAREAVGTKYADEVSELCLAHVNSDATRAAYARADMLTQRNELLQEWAGHLAGQP